MLPLKFLKMIRIRRRKKAKEKKLEWEQKNDQINKNLLKQTQEEIKFSENSSKIVVEVIIVVR